MGTNEIQMSSNVAVPVGNNTTLEARRETSSLDAFEIVEKEGVGEISKGTNEQLADDILNSAKEQGFEDALTRLANGDFENQGKGMEDEKKDTNEDDIQKLEPEEVDVEEELLKEASPLEEQIKELQKKALEFEDNNKELKDRVQALEKSNEMEMQAILQLAQVIYELIKREEDEKKKASMLEIVINIIAELMKAMFIPEDPEAKKQKTDMQPVKSENQSKNPVRFEDVVNTLIQSRENKTLKNNNIDESHLSQAA